MGRKDLLDITQAARAAGLPRQTVRELVRSGRLPGVRRRGHWLIDRSDLAAIEPLPRPMPAPEPSVAPTPTEASGGTSTLLALLGERDTELRRLHDERVRLAGLVGFLQAQLVARDTRIALLEARALPWDSGDAAENGLAPLDGHVDTAYERPVMDDPPMPAGPYPAAARQAEQPGQEQGLGQAGAPLDPSPDHRPHTGIAALWRRLVRRSSR